MNHLIRLALTTALAAGVFLSVPSVFSSAGRAAPGRGSSGSVPALAAINVNSTADAAANDGLCTLREAITSANTNATSGAAAGECAAGGADDTINFSVTGTINLGGILPDLSSNITINGPGANLLAVRRDTGGDYRIFTVQSGVVNISGLTVSNGRMPDGT